MLIVDTAPAARAASGNPLHFAVLRAEQDTLLAYAEMGYSGH